MYDDRYNHRYYHRTYRSSLSGLAGGIFLIGLALAFWAGGHFFLPIFFVALAFCTLFGSISTYNPRGAYGGLYGFFWMLMLALFFLTGSWVWFLVGAGISAILSALFVPITAALAGMGFMAANRQQPPFQQQYQQPYQNYQQPVQQSYEPYQEGYQPQQSNTYVEGGEQHQYPPQPKEEYDQPETQYPQEMPPQQQ